MNRPIGSFRQQRGAVVVIVALSIALLLGMIGLAIDLGRMFVIKTELQNAADACALAAAKELDGNAGAKVRADAAGKTVGELNLVNFQGEAVPIVPANDITYSDTLNGSYNRSISDADTKYVKCSISEPDISMLFMVVKGFGLSGSGPQTVRAFAVASLLPSQSPCVLPLGYCRGNPPTGTICAGGGPPDANGLCVGDWGSGRFDSGGGETGAFNWLDFANDAGPGAAVIAEQLITGFCGPIVGETVEAQEGLEQAAEKGWNSRFGLYKNGGGNPQYDGTPPATSDQTGYSYTATPAGQAAWPSQRNAYSNFLTHRISRDPYQGNALTGLTVSNSYNSSAAALAIGTTDRRIVTVPVVDCSGWGPSHTTTLTNHFACVLLLHPIASPGDTIYMEYRGVAGVPGSPCPAYGLPGGGGAEVPGLVK